MRNLVNIIYYIALIVYGGAFLFAFGQFVVYNGLGDFFDYIKVEEPEVNIEIDSVMEKKTIFYAFLATGALWAFTLFFAPQLISLFVEDQNILDKSVQAFRIMVSLFPLISVYYVSIFYYQALGKARASVMVSIFRQIIVMIPVAVILMKVFNLGAMGAWLAYPISDILAATVSSILVKREFKELDVKMEKVKKEKQKEKSYKKELIFN